MGTAHRGENKGKEPAVSIEALTGTDVAENAVVRLENDFGRKPNVSIPRHGVVGCAARGGVELGIQRPVWT